MTAYSHIIMRQRVTIDIPDKRYQQEVQGKVQRIIEQKLNEILEKSFSSHVPNDVVITLDQVNINLADITSNSLEESILRQVQHKLPTIIKEQVSLAIKDPLKTRVTPLPEAKLQAIKHYLLHGYFAWWMPTHNEKIIEDLYTEIYYKTPNAIKDLWLELSDKPSAIQRFIDQFSSTTVQKSIMLLRPSQAQHVLDISEDFSGLQSVLFKVAPTSTQKKVHTSIRNTVLAQSIRTFSISKNFNEVNFTKVCLQQIAKDFNIGYSALVTNLSKELSKKPLPFKLTSKLASHIVLLHDTDIISSPTSNNATRTNFSTLIKQLDDLLVQREDIDKHRLSNVLDEVCTQAKIPDTKSVLVDYLTSVLHSGRLAQHLSTKDFTKLIGAIQPAIQNTFVITQQVWQAVTSSKEANYQLIEQLTVKYLHRPSSGQQGPDAYISYLLGKLHFYGDSSLGKWSKYIKKNRAALEEKYTSDVVKILLNNLRTSNTQSSSQVQPASTASISSTDKFFVEIINKVEEHPDFAPHSSLNTLLYHLYQDLSLFIQKDISTSPDLKKKLLDSAASVFKHIITDDKQLQWATKQFVPWIKRQPSSAASQQLGNSVEIFRDKLAALLSKQAPIKEDPTDSTLESAHITIPLIKDFFIHQLLPPGYTHQSALMSNIIRQLAYIPGFQRELYDLLQQQDIRKQLVKNLVPAAKSMLLNTLVPMSIDTMVIYEQILLKSDVLRVDASADKRLILEDVFLEAISQNLEVSQEDFIQQSLLLLSYNAQLPKQEVYRRVQLSAQRYALNTPLTHNLQQLSSLFETAHPAIADVLDRAFLPIYNLLKSFLSSQDLTSDLYTQLLAFMKNAVKNRLATAVIDKELYEQIHKLFPTLLTHQKQHLFEVIKQKIQEIADKQLQTLQTSWLHFLYTGELLEGYKSATDLFNNLLLGTSSKNINDNNLSTTSPIHNLPASHIQQLTTLLTTALQAPHTTKRLVSSLPTKDLEKIVQLIAKEKSKSVINIINSIYEIWNYTGVSNLSSQDSKLAWWEAALLTLANKKINTSSEKAWLAESLSTFATILALPSNTVISCLTTYANVSSKPFKLPKESLEELDEILVVIEQEWVKSAQEEAKKAWPTQPVLQELHQLFNVGLSSFSRHTTASLEALGQQLSNLIKQQISTVKKFFYTYSKPAIVSQQIVRYFSGSLTKQLTYSLDTEAYPFIKQYIDFSVLQQPDFYEAQGVDAFSWRKHTEVATLTYLLEKQETTFNKHKYLLSILETYKKYTKQDIQPIIQSLITYHTQDNPTTTYKEVIQELQSILLTDSTQAIETQGHLEAHKQGDHAATASSLIQPPPPTLEDYQNELVVKSKHPHKEKPRKDIKLYIKNSGLIFLWPLLEELLEKQYLLEKQTFFSTLERSNAIHTLQYLVTEQLSTPEWRVTLNKLLCGMAYNDIPFSGYYLWDKKDFAKRVLEEQEKALVDANTQPPKKKRKKQLHQPAVIELPEEIALLRKNTDQVLTNVLAEWTSLKKLEKFEPFKHGFGIQEFRKYILQRDGLLQYIDQDEKEGYWHLTITWEEYDTEIRKTPWPINKIYLPFMKEELVVFWTPS